MDTDIRSGNSDSFGGLLRELRLARGLTQEELAERAGLSVRGLSDLERGVNRRARSDTRSRLARALDLDPNERVALERVAHRARMPRSITEALGAIEHQNLPGQLTSFVGRERDVAEVSKLVLAHRLVTLTGSGGIGKTSLALAVASSLNPRFADGVALAELASVTDDHLVPHAIATALGVAERPAQSMLATLMESLRRRSFLLVLDNCEHLLLSCAQVAETLLRACPRLTILATSREPLQTAPEVIWRVPPLACPADGATNALDEYEAVRLFVERAAAARPGFALTTENQEAVGEICRRLDGLPLAIELAAARMATLPPTEIARRLSDRFALLTRGNRTALPRHRTLRALFDWSHDLLSESERILFRRLAVFVGGWTLDGARCVGAVSPSSFDAPEVFDLLLALVDKSLVQAEEHDGQVRYRMLETTREYALEKLDQAGEKLAVQADHASYFATWVGGPGPQRIEAPGQRTNALPLATVAGEIDNLRAVLGSCLEQQDAETGLAIAARIYHLWFVRGPRKEGRAWLRNLLTLASAAAAPSRAAALYAAGVLAWHDGALAEAAAAYMEVDTLVRERGDVQAQAYTRTGIGIVAFMQGDGERARAALEEGARLARESGAAVPLLDSLVHLGLMAVDRGDLEAAHQALAEAGGVLPRFPTMGFRLNWLAGDMALAEGDTQRAAREYAVAVADRREKRDPTGLAISVLGLAAIATTTADAARAARLLGWSERVALAVGGQVIAEPAQRARHAWVDSVARHLLGEAAFAIVRADGYAMSMERGTAYALQHAPELEPRISTLPPVFSPRALPVELSTFIGREHELEAVRELLDTTRLLSLSGPGGIGKTRLALQVAMQLQRDCSTRVFFADLASLTEPDQLPRHVASAIGVPEQPRRSSLDTLLDALQAAPTLLILDNCEHLVGATATLSDGLLRSCPELRILATSREPLQIGGETVWHVAPLSLPPEHKHQTLQQATESESVRLFVERARARKREFALDERNAAAIVQLCRRLEGMPLAVELAAARVSVLSVQQIVDRLEDTLTMLSHAARGVPARQQTMRATIDWSYGLLSDLEQRLFERLSVFTGGWTLEAAEVVCVGEGIHASQVLELLERLVDKSLVVSLTNADREGRCRLLEPLRQYAHDRLNSRHELDVLRARHAAYFRARAESIHPNLVGSAAMFALEQLDRDHDNLRLALTWLLSAGDVERAQRLAGALGRFWLLRAHLTEGEGWLRQVLALDRPEQPSAARAECVYGLGSLLLTKGAYSEAELRLGEALALFRQTGQPIGEVWTLMGLGQAARLRGDRSAARLLLKQGIKAGRALGQSVPESMCEQLLADVSYEQGDMIEARSHAEAALASSASGGWLVAIASAHRVAGKIELALGNDTAAQRHLEASLVAARELGSDWLSAQSFVRLGLVAVKLGDVERARVYLAESVKAVAEHGHEVGLLQGDLCLSLEACAQLGVVLGQDRLALELAGAASSLREQWRLSATEIERALLHQSVATARARFGLKRSDQAQRRGAQLGPEQALLTASTVVEGAREPVMRLSEREQEVARLIVRGLTNPEIAAKLIIGERTVQTHVSNILSKLGLASRVQIARWIFEHYGVNELDL